MQKVTSIKPQKNGKRVNIYLDDKFGFGIDLENFVLLNLKVDKEYSQKEINEIVKKAEYQKVLAKLLKFATLRPRSRREIELWMKRKKVHQSLNKKLIEKLIDFELIDDSKFAAWWVGQRNTFKPRGIRALAMELRQKGIEKEIIQKVLENSDIDEEKIAKELLKRNEYKWERFDKETVKRKRNDFLARKGFGWDVIKKVSQIDSF